MSAGNFDCGKLLEAKVKMDEIWADAQANQDYIANVDALVTIQGNQRGMSFPDLTDPKKDRTVKVNWITDCATGEVSDCASDCDIDGNEIGDNCKDYELEICKEITFKVSRNRYRTSIWSAEEVAARAMLSKMKQLDEYIVAAIVSKLDAYAATATNAFVPTWASQSGGNTNVPANMWTPNLMGYFYEAAIKNKMRDAYMLSGDNLFQMNWMAEQNAGNSNGSGDASKMKTFKKFFDLFNIDATLGVAKTFMIRPSAVAFVSKNYNQNSAPIEVGGKTGNNIYSVKSKNLPFITYDVVHTVECQEVSYADGTDYFDIWKLKFKGDLLLNPANCDGTQNGLLSFKCS